MLTLHTGSKSVDTLSKSRKLHLCDFTIVIKERETTSFHHYVPSDHFLCSNNGNMLVMSKTCCASEVMSVLNQIPRPLSHTSKLTAGTPMAMIPGLSHYGIGSIV